MCAFKSSAQARARSLGERAEAHAQAYLESQGLALVVRNYRCKGGEIDLIMREPDDTLVFVEVRARRNAAFGGAAASVTSRKQQRILHAADDYLAALDETPRCRLDVVAIEPGRLDWMRDAFSAACGE